MNYNIYVWYLSFLSVINNWTTIFSNKRFESKSNIIVNINTQERNLSMSIRNNMLTKRKKSSYFFLWCDGSNNMSKKFWRICLSFLIINKSTFTTDRISDDYRNNLLRNFTVKESLHSKFNLVSVYYWINENIQIQQYPQEEKLSFTMVKQDAPE